MDGFDTENKINNINTIIINKKKRYDNNSLLTIYE